MKLKREDAEPLLRTALSKDTPKILSDRRMQIELKELAQPPKKEREKIIVPA